MHSKGIGFHKAAFDEAKAAYDWYASKNPSAAEAFIDELDAAIEQIAEFPDSGSLYLSGTRRYVMRRFPFAVIYREKKPTVEVVAVAHGHRKPGYWKKRLKH
jgi:plasmid stabilization system protein ParE